MTGVKAVVFSSTCIDAARRSSAIGRAAVCARIHHHGGAAGPRLWMRLCGPCREPKNKAHKQGTQPHAYRHINIRTYLQTHHANADKYRHRHTGPEAHTHTKTNLQTEHALAHSRTSVEFLLGCNHSASQCSIIYNIFNYYASQNNNRTARMGALLSVSL